MNLANKTFLITGASRGIGNALAKALDKEGANLILVARKTENIDLDSKHLRVNADLTHDTDLERLSKTLAQTPIDALLNVAGIGIYKPLEELKKEDLKLSLDINVVAPFALTKNLLANLQKSEMALVLTIGSGGGVMPLKNRSAYCASKFGLRGLILSLAEEFKGKKPHFCLITLGSTITTFAGKSIVEQESALKSGKAAFPVEWVANKLVEIIKNSDRETEITLYPGEQGFGEWKKTL